MDYILEKVPEYAEAKNLLEQKTATWKQEIETKKNSLTKLKDALTAEKVLLTKELIKEKEAQEKRIYSLPQPKKGIERNTEQKSVPKKITKKSRLNENNDDDYVASDEDTSYLVKQLINTASDNLGANY